MKTKRSLVAILMGCCLLVPGITVSADSSKVENVGQSEKGRSGVSESKPQKHSKEGSKQRRRDVEGKREGRIQYPPVTDVDPIH